MCNLAQIVNVLHSLLLTEEDRCIRTPAYHAFALMKPHRAKTAVQVVNDDRGPAGLSVSASREGGELVVTLVNPKHDTTLTVDCSVAGKTVSGASARALYHEDFNACNTFEAPDQVVPRAHQASATGSRLRLELPPLSVVTATAQLG